MGLTNREKDLLRAERDRLSEEIRQLMKGNHPNRLIKAINMRFEVARALLENRDIEDFIASLKHKKDRKHYTQIFITDEIPMYL